MGCLVDLKNLGLVKCNAAPANFAGMIEVPATFELTEAELADPTALQAALLAAGQNRAFLWPPFDVVEAAGEDAIYEETPLNNIPVRPGKYGWRASIARALCLHRAMYSHSGKGKRLIFIDSLGQLFVTKKSNGNYTGFTASMLNVEKLLISDGSVATKTPVLIILKDTKEIDMSGYVFDAPWVNELVSITDVVLSKPVGSPADSATTITVQVMTDCDGTPVSGLVLGDFILTETDGSPQVITAAVENNGVYTLSGVGLVDGFLTLEPAADLSIEGYETTSKLVINIP